MAAADDRRREQAMDKVLFINDVLSVREQIVEGKTSAVVMHIEVDTKAGRQVVSRSMDLRQQLLRRVRDVLDGGHMAARGRMRAAAGARPCAFQSRSRTTR